MRVVFITDDLRIKHYHMACAMRDKGVAEPCFLHTRPTFFDTKAIVKRFPYPNRILYYGRANRTRFVNDLKGDDVFTVHTKYSKKRLRAINPDVIYVNKLETIKMLESVRTDARIVLDVEDSAVIDKDTFGEFENRDAIEQEYAAMTHELVDVILFGSQMEMNWTLNDYDLKNKVCRVQYPFVAERTIPFYTDGYTPPKTEEFSVVYAGSMWRGGEYKDGYEVLERIAQTGIMIDVFLLNSWNSHNWKILTMLAEKYDNLNALKRTKIQELKQHIGKYHAGLCLSGGNYLKVAATWGMKPLEYAYAGVTPVAISVDAYSPFPIRNLSDSREFGYVAEPEEVHRKFVNNLSRFDWNFHLMDNHLDKFSELVL